MSLLLPAPKAWTVPALGGWILNVQHYAGIVPFAFQHHPEFELTLVRGPAGKRLVGDAFSPFAGRDLSLIGPHLPHGWSAEPGSADTASADWIVVFFTLDSLGAGLLDKREFTAVRKMLRSAQERGAAFPAETIAAVEPDLVGLTRQSPPLRLVAFLRILVTLSATPIAPLTSPEYHPHRDEADFNAYAKVIDLVGQDHRRNISLQEVAALAGMPVASFTRFFRRMSGTSFIDYCNAWRINRAAALLKGSDRPILEISLEVGYGNLSHFNRQFRRRIGVTPREYRGGPDEA